MQNFTIIFNGEIYNYIEIKKINRKGYVKTLSDTEVILNSFIDKGIDWSMNLLECFHFVHIIKN